MATSSPKRRLMFPDGDDEDDGPLLARLMDVDQLPAPALLHFDGSPVPHRSPVSRMATPETTPFTSRRRTRRAFRLDDEEDEDARLADGGMHFTRPVLLFPDGDDVDKHDFNPLEGIEFSPVEDEVCSGEEDGGDDHGSLLSGPYSEGSSSRHSMDVEDDDGPLMDEDDDDNSHASSLHYSSDASPYDGAPVGSGLRHFGTPMRHAARGSGGRFAPGSSSGSGDVFTLHSRRQPFRSPFATAAATPSRAGGGFALRRRSLEFELDEEEDDEGMPIMVADGDDGDDDDAVVMTVHRVPRHGLRARDRRMGRRVGRRMGRRMVLDEEEEDEMDDGDAVDEHGHHAHHHHAHHAHHAAHHGHHDYHHAHHHDDELDDDDDDTSFSDSSLLELDSDTSPVGSLEESALRSAEAAAAAAVAAMAPTTSTRPLPDSSAFETRRRHSFGKRSAPDSPVCPPTPQRTPAPLVRKNSLAATKMLCSLERSPEEEVASIRFEKDFDMRERIGEGSFSVVFRARSLEDHRMVAVKKGKRVVRSRRERARAVQEVEVFRKLGPGCPNVIAYHRAWQEGGHIYIQTELCERGSLKDFLDELSDPSAVPERTLWSWLTNICSAMAHVHAAGLVHMDMKPQNIFLTEDGVLKVGDFGMARSEGDAEDGREGDNRYLALEILRGGRTHPSADMFSVGIMFYEIVTNTQLPSNGAQWKSMRTKPELLRFPSRISPELQGVIRALMSKSHDERPTAADILHLPQAMAAEEEKDDFVVSTPMRKPARPAPLHARPAALDLLAISTPPLTGVSPESMSTPVGASTRTSTWSD